MTKLKNTKKGMAKKALSISLVAAMLATSNVPVWAAEDLFTDGSSAAVEAPVVEEPAAEVEAFSAEPAEEVTANTPALQQAETTGSEYSVELSGFTVGGTPIANNATEWGGTLSTTVSVTANKEIKDADLKAVWHVDGEETGVIANLTAGVSQELGIPLTSDMARNPVTLFVYAEKDGAVVWSYTSEAVTVQPKDISNYVKLTVTGSTRYTGDVIQPTAAPSWVDGATEQPGEIASSEAYEFSYHGSDFVNVTGEKLVVKATLKDNDAYTGSIEATYQIQPNELTISGSIDNFMKASFKSTSVKYNGGNANTAMVKKEDIELLDKKTDVDLSNYLVVDKNGYVTVTKRSDGTWVIPIIKGLPTTGYKNYNINIADGYREVVSSNALEVETRSLDSVTITIDPIQSDGQKVTTEDVLNNIHIVDKESKEDLTDELKGDLEISIPNNAIHPGIYSVTIEPKANVSMLTGNAVVELKIFNLDINEARFPGYEENGKILKPEKYYTGEAVTFTAEEIGVPSIRNTSDTGWTPLVEGRDYEITYSNNIKAGNEAQMFVIGKGNYENSIKKLTFEIKQTPVSSATANDYVEIIDTEDPADYKDAMGIVVKAKVPGTNKELTLVEGTDYTVKYDFEDKNVAGDEVVAEITLKDNGNFNNSKNVKLKVTSTLTKAALKSEYIKFKEGSTFTYTGQAIEPAFDVVIGGRIIDPKNYEVRYTNNTDAGTATLTIEGVTGGDYQGKASVTYTINPADSADLVGVIPTQEYRGYSIDIPAEDIDLTLNGNKIDVAKNFTLTYGENLNIGEGTVTLTPKSGNFTGTKELTFQITGEMLDGTGSFTYHDENGFLITDKTFDYDGTAQTFAKTTLTYKDKEGNAKTLTEGTDYEIVYVDNVYGQKGSDSKQYAAVLAVAKGKYGGNLTTTDKAVNVKDGIYTDAEGNKTVNVFAMDLIEINQQEVQLSNVTVSNGTYAAGLPVKPEVSIVVKGVKLVEGKDYDLDLSENKDIINATSSKSLTVSIDFKNGYKASKDLSKETFPWGIDKFNFANATILVDGDDVTVKCGSVDVPSSEYTVVRDGEADTITVTATEGNKNYTGSKTVSAVIETPDEKPDAPVIQEVKVSGNNATVVLAGESDAATGYDYVISTDRDCITNKDYDKVNRNVLNTETTFTYTQQGVYYAYCHAWKRVNGEKVFSDWSNAYPFVVSAVTPEQPVITSVKKSGRNLTVTWTQSANATTGYDIVMGTELRKVNGEIRPVEYGKAVKKLGPNTYSVTFRSIPKGTYYVALHAHNRTSETGVKVFSPWSNYKKVTF